MAAPPQTRLKAAALMVAVQVSTAGVNVLYKLASNDGMSVPIMIAYRFLFASAALIPLALLIDRNSRPGLTPVVFFEAFLCALFGGTMSQNLYAQSLVMTSATFAATATNLIPALTFLLAVLFREEKLSIRTKPGKAKAMGTLICISGAMALTIYRGATIKTWSIHTGLMLHKHESSKNGESVSTSHRKTLDHIKGSFLAIASAFCFSLGLIYRARMSKRYPSHYSSTSLICLMGCLQATLFALCMENKHWHHWKLGWNIRLLTVAYSGIVVTGLMVAVVMWCVRLRGSLFVSVFTPLSLILVAFAGTCFLDEMLHLGSVVGAIVIVCGLYLVLWGKAKEVKEAKQGFDDDQVHMVEVPKIDAGQNSIEAPNSYIN